MTNTDTSNGANGTPPPCPSWCVTAHGTLDGEEDWVHIGEPIYLAEGVAARLCLSIDPRNYFPDGPRLLVNSEEWTAQRAREVGAVLLALVDVLQD